VLLLAHAHGIQDGKDGKVVDLDALKTSKFGKKVRQVSVQWATPKRFRKPKCSQQNPNKKCDKLLFYLFLGLQYLSVSHFFEF
jgi:hypothetical protein